MGKALILQQLPTALICLGELQIVWKKIRVKIYQKEKKKHKFMLSNRRHNKNIFLKHDKSFANSTVFTFKINV